MLNVWSVCASVQTKLSENRGLSQVIYVALGGTGLYWDTVSPVDPSQSFLTHVLDGC